LFVLGKVSFTKEKIMTKSISIQEIQEFRSREMIGAENYILAGGFRAQLTTEESNDWHRFINEEANWKEYSKLSQRLAAIKLCKDHGMSVDAVAEIISRCDELEQSLFGIAEKWCQENVIDVSLETQGQLT
jgi:hypothetical protein